MVEGGGSFWLAVNHGRYFVVGGATTAIVLLFVSLVVATELLLFWAALIASFLLGFFVITWVQFEGLGTAWTIGIAGSAIALLGTAIAMSPMLARRMAEPGRVAFLPAEALPPDPVESARSSAFEPVRPSAGWYEDPSEQTQLRYWDGLEWTDKTR
ncbi:DUF2510 domain-containing protein [Kribbella sp. NPDC050281]|uniref:DUF2510 domain-containing protein n=1 Tax=Kribbella sp. NPDC050281 TaxID=3155515 RepID=UPI0033DA7A1F